jgi:repressor LexA
MTIGERIKNRRKELKLSQRDLAKMIGYADHSTITKIEAGKVDLPQSKIMQFAEVLGTTPAYIMGWQETQKKADSITEAVLKMKTDAEFLSVVEGLGSLDADQRALVKHLISTLLK